MSGRERSRPVFLFAPHKRYNSAIGFRFGTLQSSVWKSSQSKICVICEICGFFCCGFYFEGGKDMRKNRSLTILMLGLLALGGASRAQQDVPITLDVDATE